MRQQKIITEIIGLLGRIKSEVEISGSRYDINTDCENVFIPILNEVFDCDLINGNRIKKNYPAVDLVDEKNKISFQITSSSGITKIRETLEKIEKRKLYENYDKFYIFIIGTKDKEYKTTILDKARDEKFEFTNNNVIDIKGLISEIKFLDIEKIEKIRAVLKKQYPDNETKVYNVEKLQKINSIENVGNNNVIINGVNESNITVNITLPFDSFIESYTKNKDREIDNLYQQIEEIRKLKDYQSKDIQSLQEKINTLYNEKQGLEKQVKELLESGGKTDFSIVNDLYQKAYLEFLQGNIDAMLEILNAEKLTKNEDELFEKQAKERKQVAQNRILRAKGLALKFNFEEAKENYEKAIQIDRSAENLFEYALFLHEHNQLDKAERFYNEVVDIRSNLVKRDSRHLPELANVLNCLGCLYSKKNSLGKAEKTFNKALLIYRGLVKEKKQNYLSNVAMTLNNLGELYITNIVFEKAEPILKEAITIYSDLAKEKPKKYLQNKADTLINLGNLYYNQEIIDKALNKYKKALEAYTNLEKLHKKSYSSNIALILNNLGELYRINKEFKKAELNLNEALTKRQNLAKKNPKKYLPYLATTINNLAVLYSETKEFDKALKNYEEILQIYTELAKENPKTYLPNKAIVLVNLSIFYLQSIPNKEKSISYAKEVLEISKLFPEIPVVQQYAERAIQLLKANGVNLEEI